jgi:hypothetical protein
MMEALAAFELAGIIIQTVEFSWKVLTRTHELYKSNEKVTIFQQCEVVTLDLYDINQNLKNRKLQYTRGSHASRTTRNDDSLQTLLDECSEVASKLLARFQKLRVKGQRTRFKSFSQAIKSVFSEREIQSTMSQLANLRAAIQTHLILDLKYAKPA